MYYLILPLLIYVRYLPSISILNINCHMFLPQLSVNIATTVSRPPLRRSELSLPIVDPRFLQITLDYLHCPDSSPAKDGEDMEDNPIISYRRTKGALRRFFGTGSHFYMTGFKMENGTSVSFPLADDFKLSRACTYDAFFGDIPNGVD